MDWKFQGVTILALLFIVVCLNVEFFSSAMFRSDGNFKVCYNINSNIKYFIAVAD